MKLEQFIEQRMQRIAFIIEKTTLKILKKEMKKIKRDLKRGLFNKIRKNG